MPARWRAPAGVPEEVTAGVLARSLARREGGPLRARAGDRRGGEQERKQAKPAAEASSCPPEEGTESVEIEWNGSATLRPGRSSSSRCSRAVSSPSRPRRAHVPRAGGGRGRPPLAAARCASSPSRRSCSGATRAPTVDRTRRRSRRSRSRRAPAGSSRCGSRRAGSPRASSRPPSASRRSRSSPSPPAARRAARRLARDPALRTGRRARARARRARHAAHRGSHVRPRITGEDGVAVIPVVVPPGARGAPASGPCTSPRRRSSTPSRTARRCRLTAPSRCGSSRRVGAARRGAARGRAGARAVARLGRGHAREAGAFEVVWTLPPGAAGEERLAVRLAGAPRRRRSSASARCPGERSRWRSRSIAKR